MPSPQECNQLLTELSALETLKAEFDTAYEDALQTGNLEQVRALKVELSQRLETLKDKLNPLEQILTLKDQYANQKTILESRGVLETLSSGELGIKGIDGKEYPLPSYQEISQRIREKKEMLKVKAEQGFTQMLLVPFGMSLDTLLEKYKGTLVKHFTEGKLYFTKKNQEDPNEALVPITADKFDSNQPVYIWDNYKEADKNGGLIYFPTEFSQAHHGKKKQEILDESQSGWQIVFIEAMPNIPSEGNAQTKGGRTQIDNKGSSIKPYIKQGKTTPSPKEYLKALQEDPQYQNESGITPEDWLIYAMSYLENYDQVIDDYSGNGKVSYQLGAFFAASGNVPCACWLRGLHQAGVYGYDVDVRSDDCGVRASVRV